MCIQTIVSIDHFHTNVFIGQGSKKKDYLARPVGQYGNPILKQSSGNGIDIFVHCCVKL